MIAPRIAELIHADVDGVLRDSERAELSRALLGDPEARALYRELQQLQRTLAAVPPAEVPPNVQASLMAAIPVHAGRAARPWRIGIVLAAGLAVAAVVLRIGAGGEGFDGQHAVGTMVARDSSGPGSLPGAAGRVDGPQVAGSLQLWRSASSLVLEFDVALHDDVTVEATRDGRVVGVASLRRGGDALQQFSMELPGEPAGAGPVTVRFKVGARVVEEVKLAAPGRP